MLFFELFMLQHKDSLIEFEADRLRDFDFTDYIKACRNLQKIAIYSDMRISSKNPLPNVQIVEIESSRMSLLKCFHNLIELKVQTCDCDIVKWNLLNNCPQLQRLEIEDVSLDDFPFLPSLKYLKLSYFPSIDSEIFHRNRQLNEIVFVKCKDIWARKSKVLKIIIDYIHDLRSLTIVTEHKVDSSAISYVKKKCSNLVYFNLFKDEKCELLWTGE
jgi:hypothetical protein